MDSFSFAVVVTLKAYKDGTLFFFGESQGFFDGVSKDITMFPEHNVVLSYSVYA